MTTFIIIASLMVLAVVGWYFYREQDYRIPNPIDSEGEVVDVEVISLPGINPIKMVQGKNEPTVRYHPIIRFKLDKERKVRFRSRKGYKSEDQYIVGDQVPIVYCKENPLLAKIKE